MEDCLPWERPHTGAGVEGEESSPEEEGEAKTMCDELTAIAFSIPLCQWGRQGRQIESEVEENPGRRE